MPQLASSCASYPEEDFPTIHPEQNQPEHEQSADAFEHRRVKRSETFEDVLTEVGSEIFAHKSAHELPHAVERDWIQSRDDQWKGPAFPPARFNRRNERRQQ